MTKVRVLAIFATVLFTGSGLVWSQTSTPPLTPQQPTAAVARSMTAASSMVEERDAQVAMKGDEGCMMARHQEVTQRMQELDARLDSLVAAMNEARGEQRMDAIAAAVTELVAERKAVHHAAGSSPAAWHSPWSAARSRCCKKVPGWPLARLRGESGSGGFSELERRLLP